MKKLAYIFLFSMLPAGVFCQFSGGIGDGFSVAALILNPSLPVTISEFTAVRQPAGVQILTEVEHELNLISYHVERAASHANQPLDWEEVGSFLPAGNQGQAGSYVFEVARRNYGGKYYWYDQMNQPILVTGQPNFEISIIAFDKVKMRIENGKEDKIPFYFNGYEERVKAGKSGDKALIN